MVGELLSIFFSRRKRMSYQIPEFASKHKDLLIIIADPKTDELYATYAGHTVRGQMGEKGKKKQGIIKDILKYGRFKHGIDKFLIEMAAMLHGYRTKAKFFYVALHDALYAIAARKRKRSKE